MSSLLTDSDLVHEANVVWLEDPEGLDYVRQALDKTPRRKNKPRYARDGRMIGYIELGADAEADPDSGLYRRRVFFLLPHDRDSDPEGVYRQGAPGEAVDPRTIEPNRVGEKTPRSQLGTSSAVATTGS
ncbi:MULTISPECIES: DUF6009 family protein [Streptomycetaceae]|uniref:DUF6009 family protein n=1 Tax=Streptomycetaceae TaxID=2062 RepID=UPI0004C7EE30|nr:MULTISPECIES: DUF6009 family protein [Streptomyces]TVP36636.1 transcription factor [Streptomyces griseus subsp. griseus]WSS59647.1 DUF6009 family protein [Streptomyces sp. NBC_01178]MDX2918395.1 DUF6009 family protein [Streptomyces sp. NE06-03C]MDX3606476.1 DUF6009 family protein [Streptomyces sp. FL06-04B]MDX3739515.1 DUF6009 family protein [Streptomyces sp. ID01-15D]